METRLATLDRLRRKYGQTIEDVLAFLDDVRARLDALEHATERRAALEKERATLEKRYREAAGELTRRRKDAAKRLRAVVEKELGTLALGGSKFVVEVREAEWSERGADRVSFLIAANTGEEPRPLDRVASGGELSRIALALKTASGATATPAGVTRTLIFDEVDAGIGGSVAEAVGRRLKRLSAANQVLCVTHLAHVASLLRGEARANGPHRGRSGRARPRRAHARDRPHAVRPAHHPGGAKARRAAHPPGQCGESVKSRSSRPSAIATAPPVLR